MAELLANNAATTLNGAINNSVTSVVVTNGSVFPATGNFRIIIDSELMLVTARATNTLTVTRAIESTSAASHSNGAAVTHVLTAAGLDTFVGEEVTAQLASASTAPSARVYHNASQSISSGGGVLAFNSERWDTDTIHDNVTNNSRLTCKTAGKYQITATAQLASSSSGTARQIRLLLNGATIIAVGGGHPSSSNGFDGNVTALYNLAVNDYVQVFMYHDAAGNLDCGSTAAYTPEFMMVKVAP